MKTVQFDGRNGADSSGSTYSQGDHDTENIDPHTGCNPLRLAEWTSSHSANMRPMKGHYPSSGRAEACRNPLSDITDTYSCKVQVVLERAIA
jgi:hypothetical protein